MTEFKPGETLKVTLAPVSRLDLIKYAGASGDFNPIHTIDEEAKKQGYRVSLHMVCGRWET